MCRFLNPNFSLAAKVRGLIRQAERTHPDMQETAAMVYVGDVYVMREQTVPSKDAGWAGLQYSGETAQISSAPAMPGANEGGVHGRVD
ncbi:MAG: hypothetical protein ACYDHM_04425 [Acidiferrobacterales bacterium]